MTELAIAAKDAVANTSPELNKAGDGEKASAIAEVVKDAYSKSQLSDKPNGCVRDHDGFIVCGPIVGYERPETSNKAKESANKAIGSTTPKEELHKGR
jgi:hypothetical protein